LTIASLQKQAASIQLLSGNIDNLLAATKKNTSAIAAQEKRLLQVEETVTACNDIQHTLDDVRHHHLNNVRGDIATVKNGVHWLEERFMEGLDDANIRVDGVIKQIKMTPPGTIPPQTPPPMNGVDSSRANMVPDSFVWGSGPPDGDMGVSWGQGPSYGPSADARVEALGRQSGPNTAHSPQTPFFSSTFALEGDRAMGERPSSRRQQRSHSRLTNSPPNRGYDSRSVSPPNPYKSKRDKRQTLLNKSLNIYNI
jgi:hypothetical protein